MRDFRRIFHGVALLKGWLLVGAVFFILPAHSKPIPIRITKDIYVCKHKNIKKCRKDHRVMKSGTKLFVVKQDGRFFLLKTAEDKSYWVTSKELTGRYTQAIDVSSEKVSNSKPVKVKPQRVSQKTSKAIAKVKNLSSQKLKSSPSNDKGSEKRKIPDFTKDSAIISDIVIKDELLDESKTPEPEKISLNETAEKILENTKDNPESSNSKDSQSEETSDSNTKGYTVSHFWKFFVFFILVAFYLFNHSEEGDSVALAVLRDFGLLKHEPTGQSASLRLPKSLVNEDTEINEHFEQSQAVNKRAKVFNVPRSDSKKPSKKKKKLKNKNEKLKKTELVASSKKDGVPSEFELTQNASKISGSSSELSEKSKHEKINEISSQPEQDHKIKEKKIIDPSSSSASSSVDRDEITEEITAEILTSEHQSPEFLQDQKKDKNSDLEDGEEYTQYLYPGFDGDESESDEKTEFLSEEKFLKEHSESEDLDDADDVDDADSSEDSSVDPGKKTA